MGEAQEKHNDNVIAYPKGEDIDNDNVEDLTNGFNYSNFLKGKVLEKISENKLNKIQDYLFGKNKSLSDCSAFINPAIRQIEYFMYYWMNELDEETRKIIIWHTLNGIDDDCRKYTDFNNTPLWKYESSIFKVQHNFTCAMCGGQFWPTNLVVHHISYKHMGSEFEHPEDIAVVCKNCHMKIHNIRSGYEQNK